MKDNKTLKGIHGYLRSTFPLYKLSKNSRFTTKNVSTLIEYSCFETPAYFSKKYNLNYRMQAYAENVIYTQNSKSNSILFDLGSKKLITQDSTAFLQTTRSTNYGRLNKNALYQLFPSMHRRLITQQLSSSACASYLSKQKRILLSSEPWFNSRLKLAVHRKTNYLFPSKLLSNEFDQLISKFDSEWASILKTKSSAYCLATPSRYFSLIVDADSN
jgi:hypothetical protein